MENFEMSKKGVNVSVDTDGERAPWGQSTSSLDSDLEAHGPKTGIVEAKLDRRLKSRHLQMIAIGGCIGTGLFIGSGTAIAHAGPASALIAYAFVGTIIYSVVLALGEMSTYIPITGAFTAYAARFVDPSLGFAMGWIYAWSWLTCYALELTAAGIIIQYWAPQLNVGIWIAVFWIIISALNFLPVSVYGNIEFYFAMIKVLTILGFIIFAICIDAGAGQQGYIGFKYWHHPGAFADYLTTGALGKFVGFWSVLVQAGFAYSGTELVAIAAGETENPRKTIPAAIRKTFYRILFFFVFTIFFVGLLVPYNNEQLLSGTSSNDAAASPLVIAAQLAGVSALPSIINAVLLCTVLSAANSNVYSASRIVVGLASEGCAPKLFLRTHNGVPYYAVAFTALFGLLGFMNESAGASTGFDWLVDMSGTATFISWACINIAHIAFMKALKARGTDRDTLPYKAMWQPWFSWYGLFFNVLILLTQGFTSFMPWSTSSFFANYISVILFVAMYVGHKLFYRTKFVASLDADLDSGRKDVDGIELYEPPPPTTIWGKFWAWLN